MVLKVFVKCAYMFSFSTARWYCCVVLLLSKFIRLGKHESPLKVHMGDQKLCIIEKKNIIILKYYIREIKFNKNCSIKIIWIKCLLSLFTFMSLHTLRNIIIHNFAIFLMGIMCNMSIFIVSRYFFSFNLREKNECDSIPHFHDLIKRFFFLKKIVSWICYMDRLIFSENNL